MADEFTHKFKIVLDSGIIKGKIEFDDDGSMSFKYDSNTVTMSPKQAQSINRLFDAFLEVFRDSGKQLERITLVPYTEEP